MTRIKPMIAAALALLLALLTPCFALADSDIQDAMDVLTDESVFQEVSDLLYETAGVQIEDAGDLADFLKACDIHEIAVMAYQILGETAQMTEEELQTALKTMAEEYGIQPGDREISLVIRYVRSLEDLSQEDLEKKLDNLRDTAAGILSASDHVASFGESVGNFFDGVGDFFRGIFG